MRRLRRQKEIQIAIAGMKDQTYMSVDQAVKGIKGDITPPIEWGNTQE
jgi:hypothetical protein